MKFRGPSSIIPLACLAVTISLCGAAVGASSDKPVAEDYSHWIKVPGGLYHPDCVHEVPNGARVEENGDVTVAGSVVAHYDTCPHTPIRTGRHAEGLEPAPIGTPCNGVGCGWVEDAQMWPTLPVGQNISVVQSRWTVPPLPSESGAYVYLWNGIGTQSYSWIMQPVLQYGAATATAPDPDVYTSGEVYGSLGGNYWFIASWLVGNTDTYHSTGYRVSPGDTILGVSWQVGETTKVIFEGTRIVNRITTDYDIQITDLNTDALSELYVSIANVQWNAGYSGVLEAQGLTSCAQLPPGPGTYFSDVEIETGYPTQTYLAPNWTWVFDDFHGWGGPQCGYQVDINNRNPAASLFY
jgi:hypothetical protein